MNTQLKRALAIASSLSLLLLLVALLAAYGPASLLLADDQPKSVPNAKCQTIDPNAKPCMECPEGPDENDKYCEFTLPAGYVKGVCNTCSSCGGMTCSYYQIFNCGRAKLCTTGGFTGLGCINDGQSSWCK